MRNVTISKDKNFVLMQCEGATKPYKLDINTGIVYGLHGNAIQNMPRECHRALTFSWHKYRFCNSILNTKQIYFNKCFFY